MSPLSLTLHVVAGLGALAMGGGVLVRDPRRPRNRWFALLCAALALWNLGFAARAAELPGGAGRWTVLLMLGSCAAAPLALGFAARLAVWEPRRRRVAVGVASVAAAAVWIATWTPFRASAAWGYTAMAALGGIFVAALGIVAHRAAGRPPGPERRALAWVAAGGALAVAGGLTDFLPGAWPGGFTQFGPIGVLAFLLVTAAVVVRQRFLDVDLLLLRTAVLLAGAGLVALAFHAALWLDGQRPPFDLLYVVALVVVLAGAGFGGALTSGARAWLAPPDPLAATLVEVSRSLPDAATPQQVWATVEAAVASLPGRPRLRVLWADGAAYRPVFDSRAVQPGAPAPADGPLASTLREQRAPLTERFLQQEAAEAQGPWAAVLGAVLALFRAGDLRLAVPLLRGQRLAGWIEVAGGLAERYLTMELATALTAVGHQAADVLERIAAQADARRREKLAAVGELSAGLAHEVRNPVAAIRGAAQAIGPQATPAQRDEMLEVIQEETARLERVVAEFLDYARPAPPRREAVDVAAVVRRVLQGAALAGHTLDVGVDVAAGTPAALADPDQLRRVFENLVRNAWEAAGRGGTLRVSVHPAGAAGVAVRFEDDGPGIAPDELPRIFTPFHTTKPGGTGLGLALVHRVVEAHGGAVHAENLAGRGAAFTVVLPAASRGGRGAEEGDLPR